MRKLIQVKSPKELGMSLIGILIAIGISGIVVVVIAKVLSNSMNTQKHLEYRGELMQLRNQIVEQLSCEKTLPKTLLSSCVATTDPTGALASPPYFGLRDKKGKLIGKVNPDGSTTIGKWTFRSRCVKSATANVLQMAVARLNADGSFTKDPLNRKPFSWKPLFDENTALSSSLCAEAIAGDDEVTIITAPHVITQKMSPVSNSCGDGLFETLLGGSSRLYRAAVLCPEKSVAVNGGSDCMARKKKTNIITGIVQGLTGSSKGIVVSSRPDAGGQGWFLECCLNSGGILGGLIGGQYSEPQAYATCVKT